MKKLPCLALVFPIFLTGFACAAQEPFEAPSELYRVTLNGEPLHVYECRVSAQPFNQIYPGYQRPLDQTEMAAFVSFELPEGGAVLGIEPAVPVREVATFPRSYGLQPEIKQETNRISLAIDQARHFMVEVNGMASPLHVFVDPPPPAAWTEEVVQKRENLRYFGPGVHRPGVIHLRDNETIYLACGAVVHARIEGKRVSGVTIAGPGILDASTFPRKEFGWTIYLRDCHDYEIRDVILRDSPSWACVQKDCHDGVIDNIKLIGMWRYNNDGIDLCNTSDVRIRNCFLRTFDDNIVVKGHVHGRPREDGRVLPSRNILVENCVAYNDWNVAFKIGTETEAPVFENIVFRDSHVIRATHAAFGIHNRDSSVVHDIRFENITIDVRDNEPVPAMQTGPDETHVFRGGNIPRMVNFWNDTRKGDGGTIDGVVIKDIAINAPRMLGNTLNGLGPEADILNIRFENIVLNGKQLETLDDLPFTLKQFASGVTLEAAAR